MDRATLLLKREAVIERVKRWDGIRYYSADGNDPNAQIAGDDDPVLGFNCKGLINELLRGVGLMGHSENPAVRTIYAKFQDKAVKGEPRRGDLLFYGKIEPGKEPDITHVAIMIDDLHMMEAGGGRRGVDTDFEAAKENAFVRMRPVEFRETERVAICRIWE